jgi:hypothetical protein
MNWFALDVNFLAPSGTSLGGRVFGANLPDRKEIHRGDD